MKVSKGKPLVGRVRLLGRFLPAWALVWRVEPCRKHQERRLHLFRIMFCVYGVLICCTSARKRAVCVVCYLGTTQHHQLPLHNQSCTAGPVDNTMASHAQLKLWTTLKGINISINRRNSNQNGLPTRSGQQKRGPTGSTFVLWTLAPNAFIHDSLSAGSLILRNELQIQTIPEPKHY